jgi:hypothetical protein
MNNNFEDEIILSPFFKLWDRGDGIGEIYLFNCIVGYIHGEQQLEDGNYYDANLDETIIDTPQYDYVSCFPGYLSSSHELLKPFFNSYIDCLEHLVSLVQAIPSDFLPDKPKGSVIDVFSGQEKFLISKNFDFDIVINGATISDSILSNFSDFSSYLKKFLNSYPDIQIKFNHHCFLNGNVYFSYELQNKYFLHFVFNENNQILIGEINQSSKMKSIVMLDCSEKNYHFICLTILDKLKISSEKAKFNIKISKEFLSLVPFRKNAFIENILQTYIQPFYSTLQNQGAFILNREFQKQDSFDLTVSLNRQQIIILNQNIQAYNLNISDFLSLFIHDFFINHLKIS